MATLDPGILLSTGIEVGGETKKYIPNGVTLNNPDPVTVLPQVIIQQSWSTSI